MRKLAFVALAASAAWIAPAAAQTVPDPDPYYGVPQSAPPPQMRRMPPPGAPMMHPPMQQPMGGPPQSMQPQTFVVRRMGPGQGQAMGPERRRVEFRHMERGSMVPRRWWGPQFQVRNWQMYGFPQPYAGCRWIRYYDDALMIDGEGRVLDSRPGWGWDRFGERWDYEDDGVPFYAGDGGYDRVERYGMGGMGPMGPGPQVRQRVYVQPGPMMPPPPPPPPGYGYGYGYSYGATTMGYGGGVVVTETTITERPVVEAHTYVSYETVRVRHRRHVVRRCGCRPVAPPPPPPPGGGERG